MKLLFKLVLIIFICLFTEVAIAQENCPSQDLQGKWITGGFGIEVACDKLTILDKLNNWELSEKRRDTYYIIQNIMDNADIYVCIVRNFSSGDIITAHKKAQKIPTIQYRVIKLEQKEQNSIELSMSEKSVKYANMSRADWSLIKEDEKLFEKTILLKKL